MQTKNEQKRQVLPGGYPDYLPHFTAVLTSGVRHIVQMCASKHGVYALASDGSLWENDPMSRKWTRLPNLPQEQQPTKKGNQ